MSKSDDKLEIARQQLFRLVDILQVVLSCLEGGDCKAALKHMKRAVSETHALLGLLSNAARTIKSSPIKKDFPPNIRFLDVQIPGETFDPKKKKRQ